MRALPAQKSAQGVIDADVDKQFTFFASRDLTCAEVKAMVRAGLDRAGQPAPASTGFVGACNQNAVKARARLFLRYESATKTTTLSIDGGGSASLRGAPAMKAVWSSFLNDAPKFSAALVSRL